MCIRDSVRHAQRRHAARAAVCLAATTRCCGTTGEAGCESCLLYTSDAADERSSVDLGGRRIIKKKNNNELMRQVGLKDKDRSGAMSGEITGHKRRSRLTTVR